MFARLFAPTVEVSAHCDLPCGVYDPAQARIEAESIKAIIGKVADNDDPDFRTRAVLIKEQRSELVKHHLWVLWTDYFKPPHFEKYPQLHTLVNEATMILKASALVSVVGIAEITRNAQAVAASTFQPLEAYALAGLFYLALTLAVVAVGSVRRFR